VTARRGDRASVRSCNTVASWQWELHEGHMSWVLSGRRRRGGELDRGGHPGVHAAQRGVLAHRAYLATHMHVGSATQGPRRRAFGHVSRAAGILTSATTGGNRAVGSVDTMLHGTRRRCDGSRAWAHKWWHCSVEVVMGGRLNGVNFCRRRHVGTEQGSIGGKRPRQVDPVCQ
jgi:hypothetical protein